MYVGLASFVTMCALYLSSLPKLHHINEVAAGLKAPYASMEEGVVALLKGRLMIEIFFWSTLWAVKLSLLCMFQQLTIGLPTYTKIWWGVMAFTILAFIGCVVSAFTSCSSMHAWFSPDDECSTPRDSVARFASLWYSFVADLLTDLTIMAIPVHILYTIRISKLQRLSAGIVFTVSIITMIVSVVRVVTLNSSTKEGSVTTLWSVVEAAVALIVGCLPSFAIFIRGRMEASRVEYFNTSPTILSRTNSHIQSSKGESRTVIGSFIMEDDVELERASSNDINGKGLVDRPVVLTQGWSQK